MNYNYRRASVKRKMFILYFLYRIQCEPHNTYRKTLADYNRLLIICVTIFDHLIYAFVVYDTFKNYLTTVIKKIVFFRRTFR